MTLKILGKVLIWNLLNGPNASVMNTSPGDLMIDRYYHKSSYGPYVRF